MTEQNVSLIKLSILLSGFSNMSKYNLSFRRESPKKRPKPESPKVITETGPSALSLPPVQAVADDDAVLLQDNTADSATLAAGGGRPFHRRATRG